MSTRAGLLVVVALLGCDGPGGIVTKRGGLSAEGACALSGGLCLVVDAHASQAVEEGPAPLYRRITDALKAARAFRATSDAPIDIAVRPGTYTGTFGDNADGAYEDLPLVINVPSLRLHGATRLPLDDAGRPVRPPNAGGQTILTTDGLVPPTCLNMGFITVERARTCGAACDFTGGDGTTIEGLTLRDSTSSVMAVLVHRARDVRVRQVWADTSGGDAFDFEFASGTLEESLVTGSSHGIQAGAGNDRYPAHVVFSHNRSIGNGFSGLNLYAIESVDSLEQYIGGAQRASIEIDDICDSPPGIFFFCPTEALSADCSMPPGGLLTAKIDGNELEGNGVGLRFWLSGVIEEPTSVLHGRLDATVTGNRLFGHNNYGLDVNAGFSARDQDTMGVDVNLVVAGNQMTGGRAPALFAFQAIQELAVANIFDEQPFQGSTYNVVDLDGELGGVGPAARYDWDIPNCDPDLYPPLFLLPPVGSTTPFLYGDNCRDASAPRLHDHAFLNGVELPLGASLSPHL
jgi:hypothetical protein